ncbi:hypothetical protein FDP41_009896 [Naegleria fowleri]|uniref:Uncharacterized protein n=1 Tax=Naegleria fowleri TaxID=5763 RepID=A0A6A5AT39_NAEFO|nr:uncharacterized protein FDP41_009896 [Naegleria fowleri]KAF0971673.1 hypothetical protein FDP41_009896 [Naegleria fowleri]CAG4718032.1 unnamed protein product [Naegleria fowleri]
MSDSHQRNASAFADSKSFMSTKEYLLASEFSNYSWKVKREIIDPMLHLEVSMNDSPSFHHHDENDHHEQQVEEPSSRFDIHHQKRAWYWKVADPIDQQQQQQKQQPTSHHSETAVPSPKSFSPHGRSTTPPPSNPSSFMMKNRTSGRKSNTSLIESHHHHTHHFISSHSVREDDDDDGEEETPHQKTTIEQQEKALKALADYRLQLLQTRPVSYREFIQNSMNTLLEQVLSLYDLQNSYDATCASLLGGSPRDLLEQIRHRIGLSLEDVETVLDLYDQARYSKEKATRSSLISTQVFNVFSKSFLTILRQIEQYHVQNSLL